MNSMSSLRFPVALSTGKREVELQGEAYFEVSKTGQPFIVNVNGMQVEVLGTTFNISAYPNEEYQTTLVNGSVRVSAEKGESLNSETVATGHHRFGWQFHPSANGGYFVLYFMGKGKDQFQRSASGRHYEDTFPLV